MRVDEMLTAFLELESTIRDCSIGFNFLCNAAQSFGKEWETVCVSEFTWNQDHQTQNKKRKSYYENSKHSVQTNSRGSDPAAPRLPCGSVYLGTHSRVSPRPGAVPRHSLGVR